MKRPALPLMLLILASIFLLFLLNLLLGSVHIPFGKIWELLWGTGAASNPDTMSNQEVIWSNILWKSRVPQALTALVAVTQPLTVSISIRRITKITHYVLLLLQSVQDSKLACKIPAFLFTQYCD